MKDFEKKLIEQTRLTRREADVLAVLAAFPEENLIYERGSAYMGTTRISARVVFSLIRKILISLDSGMVEKVEYYRVNGTGLAVLRRHWGIT